MYYITYPHGKGLREQHYFSMLPFVRASVNLSFTLSTPKPLDDIQPNLLHHLKEMVENLPTISSFFNEKNVSISFHKKTWSTLSIHCVLSIAQVFFFSRKLLSGCNVEQS